MKACLKCGRNHTGICGIPAGVTLGFGARLGSIRHTNQIQPSLKGKPKVKHSSVSFLRGMLAEARVQEKKISNTMHILPVEMPEYDDLMDRLGKVESLILQLNRQIIERESK